MTSRRRRCAFCNEPLPKDARANRKFCDADCRAGREKKPAEPDVVLGPVATATEAAIGAATHLTPADAGALEALRALARKIDAWDTIVQWALNDAVQTESRPTVPTNDNVSLPTYLKFCESLGLTPLGRGRLPEKKPEAKSGKLGRLSAVPKPA